eukprot:m.24261 g.24261  ORF g.24261 m.24261 type:complete len:55 (+) comp8574_c0_seq1:97-261(+)
MITSSQQIEAPVTAPFTNKAIRHHTALTLTQTHTYCMQEKHTTKTHDISIAATA